MNESRNTTTTCIASTAIAALLWATSRTALPVPPLRSWRAVRLWLGEHSTLEVSLGVICIIAMIAALYLAAISAAAIVASRARLPRAAAAVRRLTPRTLRPLVGAALGAGVVTAAISTATPRAVSTAQATMVATAGERDAVATMYAVARPVPPPTAPLAPAAPPDQPQPTTTAAGTAPSMADAAQPAAPAPATWTIGPGEHLWLVAHETLADHLGRTPTDREVVPYWRELIDLNRDRLVDPAAPDYVYAGQVFVLPPFGP